MYATSTILSQLSS